MATTTIADLSARMRTTREQRDVTVHVAASHDPDLPTARGAADAQRAADHAFAEAHDLAPGDVVNDDGTITRAADLIDA